MPSGMFFIILGIVGGIWVIYLAVSWILSSKPSKRYFFSDEEYLGKVLRCDRFKQDEDEEQHLPE